MIQTERSDGAPQTSGQVPPAEKPVLKRKGSYAYRLVNEDWSRYTLEQIATALGCSRKMARDSIAYLGKRYGYRVKYCPSAAVSDAPPGGCWGKVVHGKCRRCLWYRQGGEYAYCLFNYYHFMPNQEKHGPIDEAEGGCDRYCEERWEPSMWVFW